MNDLPLVTFSRYESKECREGAALLILVLIVAAIGVLLGFGRLKAHQFAVKRRLNRTYQIEKMIATRDALAIVNAITEKMQRPNFTNEWPSLAFVNNPSKIVVTIDYIDDIDREDMRDDSGETQKNGGWKSFSSNESPEACIDVDFTVAHHESGDDTPVLKFSAAVSTTEVYRAAVVKRAKACWQDFDFGLLYQIDLHEPGGASASEDEQTYMDSLGTINLYLVGVKGHQYWEEHDGICDGWYGVHGYLSMLDECPWYKMELSGGGSTGTEPVRNLEIQAIDGPLRNKKRFYDGDFLYPWHNIKDKAHRRPDQLFHPGGFLLSETAFCGFGSAADDGMLFSRRGDVSSNTMLNLEDVEGFLESFREGVIVIEHVFPTNKPPITLEKRSVTVDSFVMREPTTYAVSVYHKALEKTDYDGKTATWIFQTLLPSPGQGIVGEQCILDTFGREKSDWFRERRGKVPDTTTRTAE